MNHSSQASLSITNSRSLPKPMSIELMMPSNHLILCHPLLLLPSVFPSIRVSSNESALHIRWPKYCSFSFNISPSNADPGLISFRMDWLDLLAVQGTLKSLLQHHTSKASILWCSAFFIVQLPHPYQRSNLHSYIGRKILNHWTTREAPPFSNFWWLPTILGVSSWLMAAWLQFLPPYSHAWLPPDACLYASVFSSSKKP